VLRVQGHSCRWRSEKGMGTALLLMFFWSGMVRVVLQRHSCSIAPSLHGLGSYACALYQLNVRIWLTVCVSRGGNRAGLLLY
jgi:hypothetical protein